ncbi:hypothetical protein T492DRAFT_1096619 [Pavlovales sp. CCMP2436]|nr:hypothetical protein T492DRAFT_1096619 [Pavlovales sp. CCMP2436]
MLTMVEALAQPRWHTVLRSRALLAVRGGEARTFLQGLVTNDMADVRPGAPAHVAFLNRQGRVLCDAHVIASVARPGEFMLDCDRAVRPALHSHLRKFRLRVDVEFDELDEDALAVVALGGPYVAAADAFPAGFAGAEGVVVERDPRRPELGYRALLPHAALGGVALGCGGSREVPEGMYQLTRTLLAVADGEHDMPSAEALPAEANLDIHRAISFKKGCYLGQELTARTHFTGVVRKRILPVVRLAEGWDAPIDVRSEWPRALAHLPAWCKQPVVAHALRAMEELPGPEAPLCAPAASVSLAADGSSLGKLRSSLCGTFGLAVLRFEKLLADEGAQLACAEGEGGEAQPSSEEAVRLHAILPPWIRPAQKPSS